ncbi:MULTISPECIES: hypothetical protein [unclassified Mesorhizobium]|uniref:hypothetical protein n=1 Tax=unclassified Mesorhizobium TaxID=325217 RepID=UPI00112A8F24|nr:MULTISPECIES: hypothetical protein [unclassified Mesorhizobium]TPK42265.1 hypothetical protein FJ550_29970 [Mesorhizobium sp. B2-5-2]TPL44540.1 hypothetical protein FJ961_04170 [Mesorhizobium sp. B2-4-5]TPM68727.1 hypothetical protein FJ968_29975 [Mesorhizobium sp. B2-1-6]TPN71713.1 hypothetical protein FJ985_30475 [Mesorhizobium sp. B1-1-2]
MTKVGETLADELKRLIGEYQDDDAGESTKAEAWNLIADFTVENSAAILRALTPCLDGAGAGEQLAAFMIRNSFATGHGDTFADLLAELEWQVQERASLARKNTGEATPVAWRGVVDGRTAFLCRTRDEIDRLASDYNATIEPLFASPPLPDTEEKRS